MTGARSETKRQSALLPVLVYATLTGAIVSSLGMLLVPTISEEMHVSVSTAQWMLTVNLLVGAVATPIMGRLSDGPHKKRLLLTALAVILVGSVVAASAPNFAIFLVGRALQGLAYGMVPVAIAVARRYVAADKVQFGISSISVVVSTGLGLGYPLTGILSGLFGFRSAFIFAAVFLATAVVGVAKIVPAGPDHRAETTKFDLVGATFLGIGLSALLLAVGEGANWGWASPVTIASFVGAGIMLGAWAVAETRVSNPLIDLGVLRNADVLLANATAIGLGAAMYVTLSIVSLVAQAPSSTAYGLALPVFWAGFVMLPLSAGSLGANRLVRVLAHRIEMSTLLFVGAAAVAISAFGLWLAHAELWQIMIGMLVFGVGIGMTYAAMPALIASNVAAAELGSAVSFNQVLRTVGGSFGSAISGAVLAAHLAPDLRPTSTAVNVTLGIGALGCAAVFVALVLNKLFVGATRRDKAATRS
ncbi:MFS transporter [Rhodococcus sp. NPDC127530]|uniref:MFS transporter n=1 Tax=unclassified Rhodococcus (in: high G+C Gram-positive bacteria) TaxID=192944 RepID=UPI00363D6A98